MNERVFNEKFNLKKKAISMKSDFKEKKCRKEEENTIQITTRKHNYNN